MKHVLLKNVDGSVQVMHLLPQDDGTYSTPEIEMAKWAPHKRAEVQSWRGVPAGGIPQSRAFRGAWCDVTPAAVVDIDMPRARDIHRGRLREMRAPKLAALDVEMWRAFGDGEKQKTIEAKKQALRDVTQHPSIEAAATPEELMAAIPPALQ